jgi:hypothetical protein
VSGRTSDSAAAAAPATSADAASDVQASPIVSIFLMPNSLSCVKKFELERRA